MESEVDIVVLLWIVSRLDEALKYKQSKITFGEVSYKGIIDGRDGPLPPSLSHAEIELALGVLSESSAEI